MNIELIFLFQGHSIDIQYAFGCTIIDDDERSFAAAIELARSSDIVFLFAGINQTVEKEGHDRI